MANDKLFCFSRSSSQLWRGIRIVAQSVKRSLYPAWEMDFHPPVTRPSHPGLKVPFYNNPTLKYDLQEPFSSYPSRKGLPNFTDDIFKLPPKDTLSALQSWLFFGLITEIFDALDVTITAGDFVVEEDESQYVTVKPLRRYLWLCIANVKNMLFDDEEGYVEFLDKSFARRVDNNEIGNRINSAIALANDTINQLLQPKYLEGADSELQVLLLSIMCLVEMLAKPRNSWDIFPNPYKEVKWTVDVPLLKKLHLQAGWCPHGVQWLQNRCEYVSVLYFMSFFDQRALRRNHEKCATSEFCMLDAIDESIYVTKHAVEGCSCEHIGGEVGQEILRILQKGEIPVLAVVMLGERRTRSTRLRYCSL